MLVTVCTVYGDLLFFTDFLMDLTLLFAVSRFGNFRTKGRYLLLGAVLGGVFSLVSLMPAFGLLRGWWGKLLFSLLMVKVAFPSLKGKRFFTAFLYSYLIGFAMAGAVVCLSWFFRQRGWFDLGFSYTAMGLSAALFVALFLSGAGKGYVRKNLRLGEVTEKVVLRLNGKSVDVSALFDTGNELVDPVSRLPVVVAEYDAVKSLLPAVFCEVFEQNGSADEVFTAMVPYAISSRLRLIPFQSIGREHGMMVGFRPDRISFPQRNNEHSEDVVVCLYRGDMGTKEHCRCIVNPALFDMI